MFVFTPIQESVHQDSCGCYESLVVETDFGVYTFSSAVIVTLGALGGGWRVVALGVWLVPRVLRDSGYRWMARHRHWFYTKNKTTK